MAAFYSKVVELEDGCGKIRWRMVLT